MIFYTNILFLLFYAILCNLCSGTHRGNQMFQFTTLRDRSTHVEDCMTRWDPCMFFFINVPQIVSNRLVGSWYFMEKISIFWWYYFTIEDTLWCLWQGARTFLNCIYLLTEFCIKNRHLCYNSCKWNETGFCAPTKISNCSVVEGIPWNALLWTLFSFYPLTRNWIGEAFLYTCDVYFFICKRKK